MKTKHLILFFTLMVILCLIFAPQTPPAQKETPQEDSRMTIPPIRFLMSIQIPLHAKINNMWEGAFTEPFEIAYFLFKDGTIVQFTNFLEFAIFFPPNLEEFFEVNGLKIEDLLVVVHNHLTPTRFSPADIGTYHYLKNRGFNGLFGIYYPFSKKIIFYKDE